MFLREESERKLKGILCYTEDNVVSTDFVGDSRYFFFMSISYNNTLHMKIVLIYSLY